MNWQILAQEVIDGKELNNDEALKILMTDEDEILPLLHVAFKIRKHY